MRHRCNIDETLMISMQTLVIINVVNVLISETFMFHWWFVDDSFKKHWCNIDGILMISVQTLVVINVFTVLTSEIFMLHWWFRWKHWRSSMITKHNISEHRCFINDSCIIDVWFPNLSKAAAKKIMPESTRMWKFKANKNNVRIETVRTFANQWLELRNQVFTSFL